MSIWTWLRTFAELIALALLAAVLVGSFWTGLVIVGAFVFGGD